MRTGYQYPEQVPNVSCDIVCQVAASMLCEHLDHHTLMALAEFHAAAMPDLIGIPLTSGRQQCGLLALQALRKILDADTGLLNPE